MRQHQAGQNWPVETHSTIGDEIVQVSLESAMSKAGPSQLVFAKEQKEN